MFPLARENFSLVLRLPIFKNSEKLEACKSFAFLMVSDSVMDSLESSEHKNRVYLR